MLLGDTNSFAQDNLNGEALQERSDLEDALEAKLSEGRLCKPKHVDDPSYIGQSAHGMQSIHACT